MVNSTHDTYDHWKNSLTGTTGVIQKYIDEELVIKPSLSQMQIWVNQYAEEEPSNLLLLHFNGQARQADRSYVHSLYFPGHWVYEAGSNLTKNCLSTDVVIEVSSTTPFSLSTYKDRGTTPYTNIPSYILLVKLDETGNKIWNESEVVQVKSIDAANKRLTIDRGLIFSQPENFDANKTYVAPIAGMIIDHRLMWFYNLSAHCPKNSNGKSAGECLVDELTGYFSPEGKLKNMNGIAFDVNYFDVSSEPAFDVNNDGIADGGWINNENSWQAGDYKFLKDLRGRLGNNYILTADGQHPDNQRAVGILNGIESEGLVQHNDAWRGFSRAINTHQYWQSNTSITYPFRYIVQKLMNTDDAANSTRLDRFTTATAVCLEVSVANLPDYSGFPEWIRQPGALGKPIGSLIRYAKLSPDVQELSNAQLIGKMSSDNCNIALVNNNIEVSTKSGYPANQSMTLTLSDLLFPAGDVTIFIEVQSADPLEGMTLNDRVPRNFYTSLSNLPDYGEGTNINSYYSNIYGLFGTHKSEELSFYFRRPGVVAGKQTLTFSVQGRGKFLIKSIKIYNQPDILVRSFSNGIVFVNPSLEDFVVNLSGLFQTLNLPYSEYTVPAVDATFL